jgi:hypothetical protein
MMLRPGASGLHLTTLTEWWGAKRKEPNNGSHGPLQLGLDAAGGPLLVPRQMPPDAG